ncbi:MAG: heme-copper oxidase subunit III [Actinomycetota bacterium]
MSVRTSERNDLPVIVTGTHSTAWWGMALFIAAELSLFASLLAGYYYLRFKATAWPIGGLEKPNLVPGAIATVLLLSSSLPMWWAERGIKRDDARRLRIGLLLSFLLGAAFLAIQASEYVSASFDWRTNVYGSLFFTITGLHGIHVLVGLLMGLVIQARAWRNEFDSNRYLSVETVALYWHFVDVVWIFLFSSLYLFPYLFPVR